MRQVVVIHGGDSFATYEEFWRELCNTVLHIDRLRLFDWKSKLSERLGKEYDVLQPRMPNSHNAKYKEWKLWFEKLLPQLDDQVILLGHSLGASFLAKYLSEEKVEKKILGTLLVAPPFDSDGGRTLVEFNQTTDLAGLRAQGGTITLYHSTDDPVVAFEELAKFQMHLPDATIRTFDDRGHFNHVDFPEILGDIRSLS